MQSALCVVWINTAEVSFAHISPGFGEVNWQGRGVTADRRMTLWIHSCMATQCDSPDMAGNVRQLRLTESHLRLQATSEN